MAHSSVARVGKQVPGAPARGVVRALGFAWEGVRYVAASTPNFRIHLAIAGGVMLLAAGMELPPTEWAILLLTIGAVLAAEAFNSALEALCDLVSPEYHPLVKRCKDASAGAVLLLAIAAVGVGLVLFGPRLLGFGGVR